MILVLALGFVPGARAAKFCHASFGAIEVYSSDTPANTKRLISELLEVRRQIELLVAPVPLPNPRMQLLVFSQLKDYEEFLSERPKWDDKTTQISGFTSNEFALVAAVVKEGQGYQFGRESLKYFYASFLLAYALPDAPLWIKAGVPEFLATTEVRGDGVYVGSDFMDHRGNVRASKMLALEELMNDDAVRKYYGVSKHDNVLYHESWALWHRWMTDPDPARRTQLNRLFTALREGRRGDLATVVECFGETAAKIDADRRAPARGKGYAVVESNSDAASLVRDLVLVPATELDARFAQALLSGGGRKGPGKVGYDLYRLADSNPESPRPPEGLAILAMGEQDHPLAASRWEKARELGTNNPFAYLLPVREALAMRQFSLSPRAQLPAAQCVGWRQNLDRCVALDPASLDAQYYRALLEAFAPQPDRPAVDAVEKSQALLLRPQGFLYLAIARWRLGQLAEAQHLLTALEDNQRVGPGTRALIDALLTAIREDARSKE